MRKLSLVLSLTLLPLASLPAFADGVTITVTPFLASNVYAAPSSAYSAQAQNAVAAQQTGATTYGAAGPSQFNAQSNVTTAQGIVTNFNSWMGVANPGSPYQNEYGNRMTFAVAINDNGGPKFSISQLSFSASSTDYYDAFAFSHDAGFYNYGPNYVGEIFNPNGTITYVTGGPNTQLVDALYGVGSGSSFQATCDATCSTADQQAAINAVADYPGSAYTFTGVYSLNGSTGSGTFNITPYDAVAATPEPSSLILLGTGVLGMAGAVRRRFFAR